MDHRDVKGRHGVHCNRPARDVRSILPPPRGSDSQPAQNHQARSGDQSYNNPNGTEGPLGPAQESARS